VTRIAHISDFHLPTKPGQSVNDALPDANLLEAVAELKKQTPKPDLVVLGGDLLNDGQKGNYDTIGELFKELQIPFCSVVGNHDDLKALKKSSLIEKAKGYPGYGSFEHAHLHIILLNSAGTGTSSGNIEEKQLLWLSEDLCKNQGKPTLMFMHHHPVDSGIPWLDKMKLQNADAFWEIVPPYSKNILGVFFSHLHIQLTTVIRGVLVASPPAVCFQFSGNSDASKEELSTEQPGFNLIDVQDLSIRIRTVRLAPPSSAAGAKNRPATVEEDRPPKDSKEASKKEESKA
jgi:Icc protein